MIDPLTYLQKYKVEWLYRKSKHLACATWSSGKLVGDNSGKPLVGHNVSKSHPIMRGFYRPRPLENCPPMLPYEPHAEMALVAKLLNLYKPSDITSMTLWVCRVDSSGDLSYSKPCSGCERIVTPMFKRVKWS